MIRHFLFLLLLHGCLCVPGRPSKWHGKLSSSSGATLTAACGQVTTAKHNPWAAILYVNNVFQCGATILENQLAITAAHCVLGAHTDDLTLYYGRTFQPDSGLEDQGFDRFGGQTGVLAVRIHPNYNIFDQFEGNDIAVLKLMRRIRFNDFVKPIRVVPTHHKYDTLYDRANVVRMASFGQTKGHIDSDNPDDWPDQMQQVEHKIVPEQTCNRGNDTFHFGPPRDGVCTRGRCRRKDNPGIQASFQQICKGDSGSGIVRLFQEENQYYLLAVVSYTVTHDEKVCGRSSLPSLSINTRSHRDFIYEGIFATSNSNEKGFEISTSRTATVLEESVTAIAQIERKCEDIETCESRVNCPYIGDKYKEISSTTSDDVKKSLIDHLKSKVCNKEKKAFCCPPEDLEEIIEDTFTTTSPPVRKFLFTTSSTTTSPPVENEFNCTLYLPDFGNALDNVRICDKQTDLEEWYARNSAGCNKSVNVVNIFTQNNCGVKWCGRFGAEKADRENEFKERCDSKVPEPEGTDRIYCRSLQNYLTAHKYLKC